MRSNKILVAPIGSLEEPTLVELRKSYLVVEYHGGVPPHMIGHDWGWISVTDRLPADGEFVLITGPHTVHPRRYWLAPSVGLWNEKAQCFLGDDMFASDDDSIALDRVSHWMPVPPAPNTTP